MHMHRGVPAWPGMRPHPLIAHCLLRRATMRQRGRLPGLDTQRCIQVLDSGLSTRRHNASTQESFMHWGPYADPVCALGQGRFPQTGGRQCGK